MSPLLLFICRKNSRNLRVSELVDTLLYFFTGSKTFDIFGTTMQEN
jgi:hypothetical protein